MAKYVRKTHDEWDLWTNYGYGWEIECSYDKHEDAMRDLKEYRLHMAHYGGSVRLKKRRVRNEVQPA